MCHTYVSFRDPPRPGEVGGTTIVAVGKRHNPELVSVGVRGKPRSLASDPHSSLFYSGTSPKRAKEVVGGAGREWGCICL